MNIVDCPLAHQIFLVYHVHIQFLSLAMRENEDYPKGKENFRGRGWCPRRSFEYPGLKKSLCGEYTKSIDE